jgi:hypothetical protein
MDGGDVIKGFDSGKRILICSIGVYLDDSDVSKDFGCKHRRYLGCEDVSKDFGCKNRNFNLKYRGLPVK